MKQVSHYRQFSNNYYVCPNEKVGAASAFKRSVNRRHDTLAYLRNPIFLTGFLLILGAPTGVFPRLARGEAPLATVPSEQPASTTTAQRVSSLINDLSSDDAARRKTAADELVKIGADARADILKASKSDDPGVREQALQILLKLPWWRQDDAPAAIKLLQSYGDQDIANRRLIIDALGGLNDFAGVPALHRLLNEEPSEDVRWSIVGALRKFDRDGLAEYRKADPPADLDSAPMLALYGYAWINVELDKGAALLNKCAQSEFNRPSDDDGEFDFVIKTLADIACVQKKYTDAADMRRKEYSRGSSLDDDSTPLALTELFALHADYGPLPGYDDDVKLASEAIDAAKIQYALATMFTRTGKADLAAKARHSAFTASTTRLQRYNVGGFCFEHGWNIDAETEFTEFLKMPGEPDAVSGTQGYDANVHFRLAALAIRRGDDFTAAQHKEQAIRSLGDHADGLQQSDGLGHVTPVRSDDVWADIYWRYFRAAQASHDGATADRRLAELMALHPKDGEIALDVVPILRQHHRDREADALFTSAYDDMLAKLNADPKNASLMNELAWLCAKCDEHLDLALKLATAAVKAEPQNAALIDTLAEVNFHLGRFSEAVRLETQAVDLRPQDTYMPEQLKRYKASAATQKSD